MRDIGDFFGEFNDEDYCKPIKTFNGNFNDTFNGDCIEYESKGDKDKKLSVKEYLYMIIPYLRDMINNLKTLGEGKIQLSVKINFVPSKIILMKPYYEQLE